MQVLEEKFGLLAFKVHMDLSESRPQIACALLRGRKKLGVETLIEWTWETEDVGLPRRFDTTKDLVWDLYFGLPPRDVLGELGAALGKFNPERHPLWLHIARPNGMLGLVPWERFLQPVLNIPILRLPDFLNRPGRDTSTGLSVALCASSPVAKDGFCVATYLSRLCESIVAGGPEGTRIDIFTDSESLGEVTRCLSSTMSAEHVTIHDPKKTASYVPTEATTRISGRGGRVENPWLLWMTAALSGKTMDIVHIVSHGFRSGTEGSVALAESPMLNYDQRMARFVGAAELGSFLNRVGAWSVAFSSVERNYSESGLRLLADKLGQMRPGPVLYHEIENDKELAALSSAYQFLFAGSGEPPAHPGLFLYCHPAYAESVEFEADSLIKLAKQVMGSLTGTRRHSGRDTVERPEQWISATDRYLEQRSLEAAKAVAAAQERGAEASTLAREKEAAETADTVSRMRELMEKVAAEQKGRAR